MRSIEVAKVFLSVGADKNLIAQATQLTLQEINIIEKGEELDKEEE